MARNKGEARPEDWEEADDMRQDNEEARLLQAFPDKQQDIELAEQPSHQVSLSSRRLAANDGVAPLAGFVGQEQELRPSWLCFLRDGPEAYYT